MLLLLAVLAAAAAAAAAAAIAALDDAIMYNDVLVSRRLFDLDCSCAGNPLDQQDRDVRRNMKYERDTAIAEMVLGKPSFKTSTEGWMY